MRTTSKTPSPLLHVGSKGKDVKAVEQRLHDLGYLQAKPDDRFDAKTSKAVVAFKKDHGWKGKPRGVVGERMERALGITGAHTDPASGGKTPSKLNGATYNVERDRSPAAVHKFLTGFTKSHDLDFVQVQEINGYHQALNSIPGYSLVTFPSAKDHGESGILVRDSLLKSKGSFIQSQGGWTTVRGGHAPPRAATAVKLAGWLDVVSAHQPPSVDWKNGQMVGPENRIKTYKSLSEKLAAYAKRVIGNNPNDGLLIGGDWNEPASTKGKWSPRWIAQQAGMAVHGGLATHGKGKIDWEMSYGASVTNMQVGPTGGSDHHIVTFTVSRPKGKKG